MYPYDEEDESLSQEDRDFLNTIAPLSNEEESEEEQPDLSAEINSTADEVLASEQPDMVEQLLVANASASPPKDRRQALMDELKQVQEQQRKDLRMSEILRGSAMIGQGLSGKVSGKFDIPDEIGKGLVRSAELRGKQFNDRLSTEKSATGLIDDEKLRDSSSSISQFYREMAKKRGFQVKDDMSAWDISQMFKHVGKPGSEGKVYQQVKLRNPETGIVETKLVNMSTGEMSDSLGNTGYAQNSRINPVTKQLEIFDPGAGKFVAVHDAPKAPSEPTPGSAPGQPPKMKFDVSNLDVHQRDQVEKYREKFMDDSKEDRTALNAANQIPHLLKTGEGLGGDIMRLIQNKFARASGEKGAMTETDVAPFGGRQSILDRFTRNAENWAVGKFNPGDREFLSALANAMAKRTQEDIEMRGEYYTQTLYGDFKADPRLKDIDPRAVKDILGIGIASQKSIKKKIAVKSKKTGKTMMMDEEAAKVARDKGLIE